jgi:tetratricopeptide (TPR) repeat protein
VSSSPLSAFRKLTAAFEQLEELVAQTPRQYRGLSEQLGQRYKEEKRTHHTLLDQTRELIAQGQSGSDQFAQASQRNVEQFQVYRQTLSQSASSVVNELEGPLDDVETLDEIMFTSLYEQLEALSELNDAESKVDQARASSLTRYGDASQQTNERLANVLIALSQADDSISEAVQTDHRLETEQAAQQGLALNQQAIRAYYQGLWQMALAFLEQAVCLAPNEATIWLNLTRLCLETGRLESAVKAWHMAANLAPQSVDVLYTEGLIALQHGDTKRAVEILESCVGKANSPTDEVTYRLSLAEACYSDGHPQRAVEQWQRVSEIEPMQPVAQAWLQALAEY